MSHGQSDVLAEPESSIWFMLVFVQQRFKSVCQSTQSDQILSFLPEEMLDHRLPIECHSKTDQTAEADPSLPNLYLLLDTSSSCICLQLCFDLCMFLEGDSLGMSKNGVAAS